MMEISLGKLVGSGATTDVYEYGSDKVCKLYLEKSDINHVKYEYEKTLDAYENGLPAPKVYDIIEHNGRFGIIMERIQGVTFKDDLDNHIKSCMESGASQEEIAQSILDYSAQQIKETAAALYSLHKKPCKLKSKVKDSLAWHCNNNRFLNKGEKSAVMRIIEDLPDCDHVCHGDPNPNNFIYIDGEIRIIDWVDSGNAPAFFDIARYKLSNEYTDEADLSGYPEFLVDLYNQYRNDSVRVFAAEYVRLSGIDLSDLDCWIIPTLVFCMGGKHSKNRQQRFLEGIRNGLRRI